MPVAREKKEWDLTSAKLDAQQGTTELIGRMGAAATHDFRDRGSFSIWHTHDRLDNDAIDVIASDVHFTRVLFDGEASIREAYAQLSTDRPTRSFNSFVASAETDGSICSIGAHLRPDGGVTQDVRFFAATKQSPEMLQEVFERFNFVPSFTVQDLVDQRTCFAPVSATELNVVFKRVNGLVDGEESFVKFADRTYQTPSGYKIIYGRSITVEQIQSVVWDVLDYLGCEVSRVEIWDSPSANAGSELPPPEGIWNCEAGANYKPGFDPLVPPSWLNQCVRYPLLRNVDKAQDLLWQIDIVHTETESFFDVQSSQGREYLEAFLKEHNLVGEIWDGAFPERWNTPVNPEREILRRDEEQIRRILSRG